MYGIFIWITLGTFYSIISKCIDKKNKNYSLLPTIMIGIVGGVVGGYIGRVIIKVIQFSKLLDYTNIVMPFLGAILVLYYFNYLAEEGKTSYGK